MSSTTLEIIQGLAQAAANVYDGAHDEKRRVVLTNLATYTNRHGNKNSNF